MGAMASSYSCYNREPYAVGQVLFGIDSQTGEKIQVMIPNRLSPKCQYQKHDQYADPKCVGCKHKDER